YFSIQFSSLQRNAFLQTLNQNLLRIAEAGIVSQEALDRRMNWHSSVQRELDMWGNALQADKLLRHLADSIGNSLRKEGIVDDTEALAWQRMNRYLGRLAEKFGVEMDLAKVKQVNINPSNIVTRRLIGFGGGMMGVPMMLKLWDWLKEWEVSKPVPQ
ncbi:MAG TPA: hypothetical protein VGB89_08290, partial [Bacteroidota bacterium]